MNYAPLRKANSRRRDGSGESNQNVLYKILKENNKNILKKSTKLNFIKQKNMYAYAEHYMMKIYQTAHLSSSKLT